MRASFLVACLSISCASFPVPRAQFLSTPLPQRYEVAAPVAQTWEFVATEAATRSDCGVLVESPTDRLLSWCERVSNWRDLGQDVVSPGRSFMLNSNPNAFEEMAQTPGAGYALTTVRFQEQGAHTILQIRRSYVGAESLPGVAHSRGEFERELHRKIVQRLTE